MPIFNVSLTIPEIEADTPEEAVTVAWDIMRDPPISGWVFIAEESESGEEFVIDTAMPEGEITKTKLMARR